MTIIAFGINHNTASVALREKVAFTPDSLASAFASLKNMDAVSGSVVLSTCNRTEIYLDTPNEHDPEFVAQWLAQFHNLSADEILQHSYIHTDEAALMHIMRVASGLDSLILGEPQILGQVKQAVSDAKHHDAIPTSFYKVFEHTFQVAKKVRSETEIGANAVSVAFAAVQLAKQIFSPLHKAKVLLVGAGETIELVAKHLHEQGAVHIDVANRTLSKAQEIAQAFNGTAITLNQIPSHLAKADIVISSTASQLPLIGKGMVEHALQLRKHKPMLLVDIAVPRDIEPEVGDLDEVYLYTVDDLQQIVQENIANREQAALEAQSLIEQQIAQFAQWQQAQQSVDIVKGFRQSTQHTRDALIAKAKQQLADGQQPDVVLDDFAYKLTNQLSHRPTILLNALIAQGNQAVLEEIKQVLGHADDEN